jgi:hypothetical protein
MLADFSFENFEFLLGMIIWFDMLHTVYLVSTKFQHKYMDISVAIKLLEDLISFLCEVQET